MTARLTRRERAAMQLALEVLRDSVWVPIEHRSDAEWRASRAFVEVPRAMDLLSQHCGWLPLICMPARMQTRQLARLLRARLALYLRARLRADRGEDRHRVGPCSACGGSGIGDYARDPSTGEWTASRCCEACDGHGHLFRITPLWQLAPAHGMWRHPCADGRPADLPRGEACGVCGASEPRRARR